MVHQHEEDTPASNALDHVKNKVGGSPTYFDIRNALQELWPVAGYDNNTCALLGKLAGDRKAHARRTASDDSRLMMIMSA
jgi:hypothetical protein